MKNIRVAIIVMAIAIPNFGFLGILLRIKYPLLSELFRSCMIAAGICGIILTSILYLKENKQLNDEDTKDRKPH